MQFMDAHSSVRSPIPGARGGLVHCPQVRRNRVGIRAGRGWVRAPGCLVSRTHRSQKVRALAVNADRLTIYGGRPVNSDPRDELVLKHTKLAKEKEGNSPGETSS